MNDLIQLIQSKINKNEIVTDPETILREIVDVDKILINEIQIGNLDRPDNDLAKSRVFVVYGRNQNARSAMNTFLRSIGLTPLDWGELIEACGTPSPHTIDIVDAGFRLAQAVVVLMTPDDEGRLREHLWSETEPDDEKSLRYRPRQNILFEAGMAMSSHRRRTILIEIGRINIPSDLFGIFTVRLDNTLDKREDLVRRLRMSGCSVRLEEGWKQAGDFTL